MRRTFLFEVDGSKQMVRINAPWQRGAIVNRRVRASRIGRDFHMARRISDQFSSSGRLKETVLCAGLRGIKPSNRTFTLGRGKIAPWTQRLFEG